MNRTILKIVAIFYQCGTFIDSILCLGSELLRMRARMHVTRGSPAFQALARSATSNIKMGNTSNSRLTDEAELAMFNSSLEDIQSRFATLLISVRSALEANHVIPHK